MSLDDKVSISHLIKDQFPDFYKEQGPNFIAFVKAYYEWLEQERGINFDTRKLLDYRDIDNTIDEFLGHFREKYMVGLDESIIGNQRLFQKHILDLYRAKGSLSGIQLLFRLLYNDEANVYIPSEDILIASDGVWVIPNYIEADYKDNIWDFEEQVVIGSKSGATALVERIETKSNQNLPVYILYISNTQGQFTGGENITFGDMPVVDGLKIRGTPVGLDVITSSPMFKPGDVLTDVKTISNPKPLKAVVTETYDSVGVINFKIENPGTYYSVDALVTVSQGANTTGAGANFRVQSINNTFNFLYNTDYLIDYVSQPLNSTNFGFPALPVTNINTNLLAALTLDTIEVGNIDRILVLNPGTGYDGDVNVKVVDPYTSTRGIFTTSSELSGTDAVISGKSMVGLGLVESVSIIDSSFGYNIAGQILSLQTEDELKTVNASVIIGGAGHLEGYYDDTKGFLSANKYLFDGHYYQNFSYVIKSSHQLSDYVEIYKKIMHIAGNRLYGRLVINGKQNFGLSGKHSGIKQS